MNTLQKPNYIGLVFYTATFQKLKQSGKVKQNCYLVSQSRRRPSGIDVNICQGHSLHTASASKASLHGLNIQSILKPGGWSRESEFAKYYKKDLFIDQSLAVFFILSYVYYFKYVN